MMRVLWLCGLPQHIQDEALRGEKLGAHAAWSWVLGHLPPPKGVDLHLACPVTKGPWKNRSFEYAGATIHLVRCPPGRVQTGYLFERYFFAPLYERIRPSLVHGWGTEASYGMIARALAPRHHVVQVQGLLQEYLVYLPKQIRYRYLAWRERCTLRQARHIFVESEYSRSITAPYTGPAAQIYRVDHPLRPEFLAGPISSGAARDALFIGALCDRKGYLDAVHAFAAGAPPDWRLTMLGGGSADSIASLRKVISDYAMQDRIEHIQHLSAGEVVELMHRASVFLLPSYMDTGPTALKEALAIGLWPVCYDNSGPKEYIERFGYGSVAKTGSQEDLAAVLRHALHTCPWQEPGRADAAANRIRQELCADTIWGQLRSLYGKIATE
jgi:glycosyltransferase involved in cell wall biosynthesis